MAEFTWTAAQRAAIETTGQSVLVSAGAGSGKTAVLAARCAYLVSDARPPCNIDELLVVTFTDAAAAEMRQRIAQALRQRMAIAPNQGRIKYQLALLDSAHISTIHAFCRRLLNRYFAQADIDPQAPIMDPHDAALLRQETAQGVFEHLAEQEGRRGEAFLDLVAAYGAAGEGALQRLILKISDFLDSLPDPDDWIEETQARFKSARPAVLAKPWLEQLCDTLRAELAEQIRTVEKQLRNLSACPAYLDEFLPPLSDYRDALEVWLEKLDSNPLPKTIDGICTGAIADFKFSTIPAKRGRMYKDLGEAEQAEFAAAQDLVKGVRDKLYKKRLAESFSRFTCADWAEGIARTAPHVRTLLTILQSVRKQYRAAKADLGVVDFGDLQRVTLDLLRDETTGIAARLRDDFRHVLVDEFQDVNPVQAEILRLISHESGAKRPGNLFAVGDVKQSIYRFRLAEPRLFLQRHRAFQKTDPKADRGAVGRAIHLVENFRSSREIITAINGVFEKIMAPDLGGIAYDEHAKLKYGPDDAKPAGGPALELHTLQKLSRADDTGDDDTDALDWEQIEREAYVIAERIGSLVEQGRRYGDIVILQRSMKLRTAVLARTLSQLDIPVFADGSGGFFESIEVLDMLALLSLLDNEQQDIPMAAVLRCPIFGEPLTDEQLAELRVALPDAERSLPFHVAVRRYAEAGRDSILKSRLVAILDQLRRWRHRSRRRPLADVLWQVYEESGYPARISGLRDGRQRRANLLQLHEYARQFGDFRRQGLHRFLQFIDTLRESGADLDAGTVATPAGNVVRIMTVHRSKGLEFPVVILGELGKQFNMADARGAILIDRRLGIGMQAVDVDRRITYPTLPHRLVARAVKDQSLAEELRILYVAMTRAKEKLILVGTGNPPKLSVSTTEDDGPLPLLERQGAQGMLDWVAGAIAAQPAGRVTLLSDPPNPEAVFAARHYSAEEMSTWRIEPHIPTKASQRLQKLSHMAPLGHPPVSAGAQPVVDLVRRRLTTPYAGRAMTHIPAVVAASALKHRYMALHDIEDPAAEWSAGEPRDAKPAASARRFKTPDFLSRSRDPEPTSLGTWTHALLQRVDLARPCDKADLIRQRKELVSAGVLARDEAAAVDLDAIAWFFTTPLGQRLRQPSTRHLREWPFTLGIDPHRYNPEAGAGDTEDLVLVRGIIDLLFDTGEGWEILDYKTDNVRGENLQQRADLYAGQLRIYADAAEAVWKRRPKRCWLAFLTPRQIVEL